MLRHGDEGYIDDYVPSHEEVREMKENMMK